MAILNELEERGYATRRRDPEDRRRHLVEVSEQGIAVIQEVSAVMDSVEEDLLEDLDPGERSQLEGLLTSIWERSGGYEAYSKAEEPRPAARRPERRAPAQSVEPTIRNTGWSGAILRSSTSGESPPTPPKKTPTSHFQRVR